MTRLYAHRGACAERPENTIEAFRRGLDAGADALETDAHLTRDGQVVLSHDHTGERMAGISRAIRECTLAEVRAWDAGWGFVDRGGGRPFAGRGVRVPTLEEALAEFPGVFLNIDLKGAPAEMVPAALAVLRKMKAEGRALLTSFDSATLRLIRSSGWEGATGMGQREVAGVALLPLPLLRLLRPRGDRAQVPARARGVVLASPGFVGKCHALGIAVDFWVVNEPEEALRLVALGADGVMTDDPAAIAPALGKRAG